jgi:hypothetical protein
MKKLFIVIIPLLSLGLASFSINPIIKNMGVNDPHIRIFDVQSRGSGELEKAGEHAIFFK